ncbi:MAG: hypothetical protein KA184_19100 [Candidatus Hydrogenedentes bacterium]|nr:hypothetical protein [Candidatus Hydrogenedentota bacterium]
MATEPQPEKKKPLRGKLKTVLRFCRTFLELTIVLSAVWWFCLPYYAFIIAQLSAGILVNALGTPIDAAYIEQGGILFEVTALHASAQPAPAETGETASAEATAAPACAAAAWMCSVKESFRRGIRDIDRGSIDAKERGNAMHTWLLLNIDARLVFALGDHMLRFPIALLVTNMAPYLALVLATPGLRLFRRLFILVLGAAILFGGHILFVTLALYFREAIAAAPHIPHAIAQFYLTLPFLLWIILAYWGRITASFADTSNAGNE